MGRGTTEFTDTSENHGRMIERRRFQRYDVDVPVMIELTDRGGSTPAFHQTANISARGAFFASPGSYVIGERVKVSMSLAFSEGDELFPSGQTILITVMGQVSRSDYGGTAVHFDDNYQVSNAQSSAGISMALFQ